MLEAIGNTPVIRIDEKNKILLKLEGENLFGSVKDRAAAYIIERGLESGLINSNTEIVESSSGNFAVALAGVCKVKRIKFTCVIDPLTSEINRKILEIFGANVIIAENPDEYGNYVKDRIEIVKSLIQLKKNVFWPNQYDSSLICEAYEKTIGAEIAALSQIDYVFVATSTCGTIAGVSRAVKARHPYAQIIAVDVEGSKIFEESCNIKRITGVGASFKPKNIDRAMIDDFVIISTEDCIRGCEELINYGIFAGGSSGAVFVACKKYSFNDEMRDKVVMGILPDRGERYLDTIYSSKWQNTFAHKIIT